MESVLVNPNIATIQTDRRMADKIYFLPVNPDFVTEVIEKERPDAITARVRRPDRAELRRGSGEEGDPREVRREGPGHARSHGIEITEDRELFKETMQDVGRLGAPGASRPTPSRTPSG